MRTKVMLALALLVNATACGMLDRDPSPDDTTSTVVEGDSLPDGALPDSVAADSVVADSLLVDGATTPDTAAAGTTQVATPAAPLTALEDQLGTLLSSQLATIQRLDSISAAVAALGADTATVGDASEEVIGAARSFGLRIAMSVVVLLLFNILVRSLVWLLDALAERNPSRRLFYKRLVPIVRILLWVFAAYLIVRVIFEVDAQGLLAATAAIGVAIGFAAQDLLKNLFGGLIVVFDQPFQVGDKVSVGGTYGEVVSIGLRSTRIVTPDDNLVSVPNAQVVDQQVSNANAGELHCQVVTDLYLPGWADEAAAKRIAFEAASSSKYVYLNKPIVTLVADVFKETFLTRVRVKAYVLDPRFEFLLQSDVTERAREGFRAAGLLSSDHMLHGLVERSAVGRPARDGGTLARDGATLAPDHGAPTPDVGTPAPEEPTDERG